MGDGRIPGISPHCSWLLTSLHRVARLEVDRKLIASLDMTNTEIFLAVTTFCHLYTTVSRMEAEWCSGALR